MNIFSTSYISPFVFENTHNSTLLLIFYDVNFHTFLFVWFTMMCTTHVMVWLPKDAFGNWELHCEWKQRKSVFSFSNIERIARFHHILILSQFVMSCEYVLKSFTCSSVSNCCVQISAIRYHYHIKHKTMKAFASN